MMNNNIRFMKKAVSQRNRRGTVFHIKETSKERREKSDTREPRKEISPKSDQRKMY